MEEKIVDQRIPHIIKMYKAGYSIKEIGKQIHMSKDRVRKIVKQENVFVQNRRVTLISTDKYMASEERQKRNIRELDKITREEIDALRSNIPLGFEFEIKTFKSCGDIGKETLAILEPHIKKVTVVDKKNKYFCQVKLEGTEVLEAVLWSDLAIMKRQNKIIL